MFSVIVKEDRKRTIPGFLNTDKPNLIVSQSEDILGSVLSLYTGTNSLPDADEVLICNEHTKLEEVSY